MRILTILISLVAFGRVSFADTESTAGGWGTNCHADTVSCNSGRQLKCQITDVKSNELSSCTDHRGNVGWVLCEAFDAEGHVIVRTLDFCP